MEYAIRIRTALKHAARCALGARAPALPLALLRATVDARLGLGFCPGGGRGEVGVVVDWLFDELLVRRVFPLDTLVEQ